MNPWNGVGGGGGVYWARACSNAASTSALADNVFKVGFMLLVFRFAQIGFKDGSKQVF